MLSVRVNGEEVHGWRRWALVAWAVALLAPLMVASVALSLWIGVAFIPLALLGGCVWLMVVVLERVLPNISLRSKE